MLLFVIAFFFFFNDTATTEIYTLSLHDALPIFRDPGTAPVEVDHVGGRRGRRRQRSEEHTSELQSRLHLVCRLLLEKKKKDNSIILKPTRINTPLHSYSVLTSASPLRRSQYYAPYR